MHINVIHRRISLQTKAIQKHRGKNAILIGLAGVITATAAHADIRDQMDVQTGRVEMVMPGMSAERVTLQVKDALSQWAIPANSNIRSLPSTIPARPDEPGIKQVIVSGAPAVEYHCQTAYAEVTKNPPPVKNAFMFAAEMTQACIYPFQKGAKVYLIFTSVKKTESLTSGLFNGITRAIRGQDDEWMSKQLNDSVAAIRKNIPSLLVEKLEVPGRAPQEPDKEAVAALMPPKPSATATVQQVATPSLAQVEASQPNSTQAKIEARKNLTAMGMSYHSQEQFIAAIQRKDDVAVELFLISGGVDLAAKDKSGKTPLDVARTTGVASITKIISDRLNPPVVEPAATKPAPSTTLTPGKPLNGTASAQTDALPSQEEYEAAKATIPAEDMKELLASIDAQNLSPEQKELFKRRSVIQIAKLKAQVKAFTDRIDPETGRLR